MIYHPEKNPDQAMIVTSVVALGGIAGAFLHVFIPVVSLLYWMQYTAILSYMQFRKKSKHPWSNLTEILLHPQLRFFVFEFIAVLGLLTIIFYDTIYIAASVLLVWWLFDLNYYLYYRSLSKLKK